MWKLNKLKEVYHSEISNGTMDETAKKILLRELDTLSSTLKRGKYSLPYKVKYTYRIAKFKSMLMKVG